MAVRVGSARGEGPFLEPAAPVTAGEEIEIVNPGEPVAHLVPARRDADRRLGVDEGVFVVPDGFNDPLPDAIIAGFDR